MAAIPFWFGPSERPLFGWWHGPDEGRARGGVALCPPLGQEYMGTHRTFRMLAEALAQAGFVALRFDYDGTGDSAGTMLDPGRVEAWVSSAVAAVRCLGNAGLSRIGLLGMRLGATLAAEAAARHGGLDDLVLWDPSRAGRTFVREQQALAKLSAEIAVGQEALPDGWVEAPAWVFTAETASDLKKLDIANTQGPLAARALILTRSDRGADAKLTERLADPAVTWADAVDQAGLIDAITSQNAVPHRAIETIVAWMTEHGPAELSAYEPPVTIPATVDVDGVAVTETPVALGPNQLFGVVTEAPHNSGGPTALFINVAAEHHVGPARLWVELARSWAATAGLRSVRFDLHGLGDSPPAPATAHQELYAPSATSDVVEAARALNPDDPADAVLIGLCSGAYAAMDAGLELCPRGVFAINPVMNYRPSTFPAGPPADRPLVHGLRHRITPAMYDRLSQLRFAAREVAAVALDRLDRVALPRTVLRRLAERGTEVVLVAGAQQAAGPPAPPRKGLLPKAADGIVITSPPDLDHALLAFGPRQRAAQLLTDHVVRITGRPRRR